MYYELTDRFEVSSDIEKVWSFFSRAENLPDITPPQMRFTIHTPKPIQIQEGTILDYTIRWMNVPVRWRTRIIDWTPMRQFIDLQLRGPYTLWHHQHTFEPLPGGGVLCADRVIYKLPAGPMGRLTHALLVKRQLLGIFRFRRRVIADRLGWVQGLQEDVEVRAL